MAHHGLILSKDGGTVLNTAQTSVIQLFIHKQQDHINAVYFNRVKTFVAYGVLGKQRIGKKM